ncbi:MAG: thiamine phosphate synthase [Candidatus Lokiarchaeota archaeon]|nr:thiamine phosphate synthase [Candidatus Lokiarchaeota archaeon]
MKDFVKLYLVTDRGLAGNRDFEEIILKSIEGGVTIVQLREKKMDAKEFLINASHLKKKLDALDIPLIINDRVDIAFASNASGVHLGQSDLPIKHARKILGENKIIGVSISTVAEALKAEKESADYIAISPIFDTPTKTDTDPAVGLDGIAAIKDSIQIPIVGIGGINKTNARSVIKAGCDGIAVVSAIIAAVNPKDAAFELNNEIKKGLKEKK